MKRLLPPLLLGFGIAMALIIGRRMSTDAMAVVIGVAVGVAASVPTSLLLVAMLKRERQSWRAEQPMQQMYPQMPAPNVIVVDPSRYLPQHQQAQYPVPPLDYGQDAGMRRLRVIGADDD